VSAEDAFLAYLRTVGLEPLKPISLPEGKLVRYRGEGDKPGALNCYAVLHTHPEAWGAAGSWRTGARHTWREQGDRKRTSVELRVLRDQRRAAEQARMADEQRAHAEAQAKAARLWGLGKPATDAHPYSQRKQVHAYGLRQLGGRLMVPVRDAKGVLWSLQFIDADGTKRFLTGGRIQGCYCAIGAPRDVLLVCEGYATAATLFEATGHAVAAAFSANNLGRVAVALRVKFPQARIVICGDNDAHTPGNPGRTAAMAAAQAVGGLWVIPKFEEQGQ